MEDYLALIPSWAYFVATYVLGIISGAFASSLGESLNERRRRRQLKRDADQEWKLIESKYTELIAEMREDMSNPKNRHTRIFFVKSSKTSIGSSNEPAFEYHTDKHSNIYAAVADLEARDYIRDITPGNCPMYRMSENFAERLINATRGHLPF